MEQIDNPSHIHDFTYLWSSEPLIEDTCKIEIKAHQCKECFTVIVSMYTYTKDTEGSGDWVEVACKSKYIGGNKKVTPEEVTALLGKESIWNK